MNAVHDTVLCSTCGHVAYPAQVLNDRFALVPSCPACGAEHRGFSVNDMMETPLVPEQKVATVTPIHKGGFIRPEPAPRPPAPTDILEHIRERIHTLDLEIAKSAGYATERKQLARMLAAAEKTK